MKTRNSIKACHFVRILTILTLNVFLGGDVTSLAAEDTRTYKADMTTIRSFFGGGVIDGKICVIGGTPSNSSLTSAVEMYDPVADARTKLANKPSALDNHATCTFNGKIYAFGGTCHDMCSTPKKNIYVYDPKIDTWTQKGGKK